jgi:hypothetical protein
MMARRGKWMERETGIEPATNSLEGCDSTTELLPPRRSIASLARASTGKPADVQLTLSRQSRVGQDADPGTRCLAKPSLDRQTHSPPPPRAHVAHGFLRRRLVAREGLEPSKPLGRQIYSLLRLTASLPRHLMYLWNQCFGAFLRTGVHSSLELAKGFEPPTR